MIRNFYLIFIFFVGCLPASSMGQTRCPAGAQAGSAQCLPDDEEGGQARPTGEWIKTWGALVSSNAGHGAWTSKGKLSESDAVDDAVSRCRSTGVSDCNVDSTYFNQCVAVAGSSSAIGLSIAKAKDQPTAKKAALANCQKRNAAQCTVEFSDCTDPVFRKF